MPHNQFLLLGICYHTQNKHALKRHLNALQSTLIFNKYSRFCLWFFHLRNRDSTKRKTVILKQYNALQEVNKSIFLLLFLALILSSSDVLQGLPGATVDSFKPCKALYFARAGGSAIPLYIDNKKDKRFLFACLFWLLFGFMLCML